MGNTIKLVSGFVLFVIGGLIAYEATIYNLLDLLLIAGVVISIVGILLMLSYFFEANADRTTNKIKEFLDTRDNNRSSLRGFDKSSYKMAADRPLNVRADYDDFDSSEYGELNVKDYESSPRDYFKNTDYQYDESKMVLNVPYQEEADVDFDKKLDFTPHFAKPLEVTRAPKRRTYEYVDEEDEDISEIIVEQDKTSDIQQALSQEEPIETVNVQKDVVPEAGNSRDIKIDINNPESLPIPSSLNSYILSKNGVLTSNEAFENLAVDVSKEIMLEIPSLKNLSDRFLSYVPTSYSRVIINEFDVSDMSYMFIISSLLKQGVHIKTIPKVHSINLITDDSHAMIISEGNNNMEYGAIYDDLNSISNIRADFERTWSIASNLDEAILDSSHSGVA